MYLSHNGINLKIPSWHVGLLPSQPFINSHLNFLTVKLASFLGLIQRPRISSSMCTVITAVPHMLCQLVWSAFICDKIFLNLLHYFLTFFTLLMPSPYFLINWGWILIREMCFTHKTELQYKFLCSPIILLLHINLSPEEHLTWLMCRLLHVTFTTNAITCQKMKCLINTELEAREIYLLNGPYTRIYLTT